MLAGVLDAATCGDLRSIAFAISAGVVWTLPIYELAIMTAVELRERGAGAAASTVVTHEESPLALFGPEASTAVGRLLDDHRIRLVGGRVAAVHSHQLKLADGTTIPADATVVVPPLQGPWIEGLPTDEHGSRLERLLAVGGGRYASQLERLRRAPVEPTAAGLVAALERLGELGALAAGLGGLEALPVARMRGLTVDAAARRAGDLAKMSGARRLATRVAFAAVVARRG